MAVGRDGVTGGLWFVSAGIVLICIAPLLIYRVTVGAGAPWLAGPALGVQVTIVVWVMTRRLAIWWRALLAILALDVVAISIFLLGLTARSVGLAVGGICHAMAYSGLLIWFATSLRPGREPVVTGLARQMRRTMPLEVVRYTRAVTIAWCGFFAAQLGISAALLAGAPEATWSFFVNLLNVPLIVAMILAEFVCRLVLFHHEQRTGLIATLAGLRHIRGAPGGRP
ncbi:MAG: hypothetical protein QOG73_3110 [Acetobacteraceae bacterium]|nr:hypothetical protein [Acetobacteraceae bacterium]